ncbi:MAG: hypothetical protein NVS3B12_30860 [Acidimicrobiales bacterium]
MSILAMVGAAHVRLPQGAQGNRDNLDTPEPVYIDPPLPVPLAVKQQWEMATHEKAQVRAAALRATRLYPGAVGELISRELLSWEDFGMRIAGHALIMRAVRDIMSAEETR